jgi:L-serine dehydratase
MRAANLFTHRLGTEGVLVATSRIRCELFGSLGATGKGHGTGTAVMLGLAGFEPDTVDPDAIPGILECIRSECKIDLPAQGSIKFNEKEDILFFASKVLDFHSNGMTFSAFNKNGNILSSQTYYSVGGGFVVSEQVAEDGSRHKAIAPDITVLPFPFHSGDQLLELTEREECTIAELMRRNERHWRTDKEIDSGLLRIWGVMQDCVARGCSAEGTLPGPFKVRRRAATLRTALSAPLGPSGLPDPLAVMDWVNLFALAVNEENAAGGRVVTAPTNGAAGIIPAVLHYYDKFVVNHSDAGVIDFLLTAGAIGLLYKENASISGAEVGCQGEVGVACSMAAAALCAVLGGTPAQVENAAEIGMEHHLGLTCDPVGGLVQIPCIERNAIASVKAINAARMALYGDGTHHVSLDKVIKTMRETGADMMTKYKETSRGGLAVNIVEC